MLLRHIRYLLAVAEHGNFTRAAAALHVSQPTLSLQIRQLEESLGVCLLDRSGRTVRTTDAGAVYLDHARRALRELDAAKRAIDDVRELTRGVLRLAMTPTFTAYFVGPLVARFHALHPGIAVRIREMPLDTIETALASDEIDVGIAFDSVRSDDLDCEILFREKLSLVVGVCHPFTRRSGVVTPAVLAREPLALLSADFATRTFVDAYFQRHGIAPPAAIEANSINALVEIVRHGQLATMLPQAIAAADAGLRNIAMSPEPGYRNVALLRRKGSYQSFAVTAFSALARSEGQP